jgi:hypothetical protein
MTDDMPWDDYEDCDDGYCDCAALHTISEIDCGQCDCCGKPISQEEYS